MKKAGAWYNGFSWDERSEHLKAQNNLIASGDLAKPSGPCGICGDPDTPVEFHSEDYALPYSWKPPAAFVVCAYCHRHQLHRRFWRPDHWTAYLAHVRRGGYARDLENPTVRIEFEYFRWAVRRGRSAKLYPLRPYAAVPGTEWFARLTMSVQSLRDPAARPR